MLSKKLADAINDQMKNEVYSAYLYMAMAAHCDTSALPGFGKWLKVQAGEEWAHAMKFYEFLVDRNARPVFEAIPAPPGQYKSMLDVFEHVLSHEQHVTALIHKLYELSLKEKDYAAQVLLHWYINEQVEEEKSAQEVVDQLKMVQEKGLVYLDRHMAKRGEKE